jgi:hypothetical protein
MGLLNLANTQPVPVADEGVASSDPSTWQTVNYAGQYNPFDSAPTKSIAYYDPKSGNLYNSQDPNANIIANKEALNLYGGVASNEAQNMLQGENGSYIDPSGNTHTEYSLNRDPSKIQQDYQLYQSDPNSYYGQLASSLSNTGSDQVHDITGMSNSQYKNLESLKDVNPLAYWNARLQDSAAAAGFQTGHNGQANPAFDARLQADYLAAKNAGLPQQQLDAIVKNVYQQGITSSAQQVAQQDHGNPYFDSIKFIAPLALGAYGLDMALGAGAAGATAVGEGATASTLPSLSWEAPQIGALPASTGTFGSFTAPALGAEATGIGMTGAIPSGVMVGDGTLGTVMGATYQAAGPGQFALDALGNPIQASSIGIDGFAPTTGISAKDILTNANRLKNIAKAISSTGTKTAGTSSGTSAATQKALANALKPSSTGPTNFTAMNMNQSPYLQAQQVANIQTPLKQHDFLADLAQAGKTQPTMADILRTKEA